ncbi:MAG TPA: anti-sigma factor [Acidimicrobiales bacterium]
MTRDEWTTENERELDALGAELHGLLSDATLWGEPGDDVEGHLVGAIAAESGITVESDTVATRATPGAGDHLGRGVDDRPGPAGSGRRPLLRARTALVALGAAAAVLVGIVLVVASLSNEDTTRIALAGTELAPDATGTATVTETQSGLRIELDASGLPRLDGGRFYQAWLKSADGVLVPIGTFHTGDKVVLWAGVTLDEYPTLTVTREEADGNQASSGERVLAGSVAP